MALCDAHIPPGPGHPDLVDPNPTYGFQAGTAEAGVASITVELIPFAAVPVLDGTRSPAVALSATGQVVYVADDGGSSSVHGVPLEDAAGDRVFGVVDDVVWSAVATPDGRHAYLLLIRRDGRGDAGVVRLALDGSGEVEQVLPPAMPNAFGGIQLAAVLPFSARMQLAVDGSQLVRQVCANAGDCSTDVVSTADGIVTPIPSRDVIGAGDGQVVALGNCVDVGICELTALDLATVQEETLAGRVIGAQAAMTAGRAVVVFGAEPVNGGATEVRAIDLATRDEALLLVARPDAPISVGSGLGGPTFEAPDGWTVVGFGQSTVGVSLDGADPVELFWQHDAACGPAVVCNG
jgi:hypothetical protein